MTVSARRRHECAGFQLVYFARNGQRQLVSTIRNRLIYVFNLLKIDAAQTRNAIRVLTALVQSQRRSEYDSRKQGVRALCIAPLYLRVG
jgi:hypothetical protein